MIKKKIISSDKNFKIQQIDLPDEIFDKQKTVKNKPIKKKLKKSLGNSRKIVTMYSNEKYPDFTANELHDYGNNIKTLPHPIPIYKSLDISEEQQKIISEIVVETLDRDDGELIPRLVVKTVNSFAVLNMGDDEKDEVISLLWAMDRIELVKKSSQLTGLFTLIFSWQTISDKNRLVFNEYTADNMFTVKNNFSSFDDYLAKFNELLMQSKPLQYLISATMAAPILTLMNQKYNYDLHSYIINIIGQKRRFAVS